MLTDLGFQPVPLVVHAARALAAADAHNALSAAHADAHPRARGPAAHRRPLAASHVARRPASILPRRAPGATGYTTTHYCTACLVKQKPDQSTVFRLYCKQEKQSWKPVSTVEFV